MTVVSSPATADEGEVVTVWLLEIVGRGPTFLAEIKEPTEPPATGGAASWLAARGRALRAEIDRAEGFVGRTVGRVWRRLQRLIAPDEHLFRRLRRAPTLRIDHPSAMPRDEAERLWEEYLRRNLKRHRLWFVVDVLLAAPSFVLAFIPGPNVIGYWIAYRSVAHGLVLLGIRRARTGRVPVSYRSSMDLDGPIDPGDHGSIERMARVLPLPDLPLLLSRIDPDRFPE